LRGKGRLRGAAPYKATIGADFLTKFYTAFRTRALCVPVQLVLRVPLTHDSLPHFCAMNDTPSRPVRFPTKSRRASTTGRSPSADSTPSERLFPQRIPIPGALRAEHLGHRRCGRPILFSSIQSFLHKSNDRRDESLVNCEVQFQWGYFWSFSLEFAIVYILRSVVSRPPRPPFPQVRSDGRRPGRCLPKGGNHSSHPLSYP